MKIALALALTLALTGCGESGRGRGTATLWVTENRGAHVLYAGSVPAGLDGIQIVERKFKVTTRYGGRYLQSIDGVSGSLAQQRDWFYFVNGIEGGRSAAELTVHPGDVIWWDYRRWSGGSMSVPVVLGAYPEPFLHGFPGKTSVKSSDRPLAAQIAAQVHGVVNAAATPRNVIEVGGTLPPETAHIERFRSGVLLQLGTAVAKRLAANPRALRFHY